jgi:hypothetical protein
MIIFDAHLDLAWNAFDWNRDLRLTRDQIRHVETDAGMTDKGRWFESSTAPARHGSGSRAAPIRSGCGAGPFAAINTYPISLPGSSGAGPATRSSGPTGPGPFPDRPGRGLRMGTCDPALKNSR